MTKLIPIILIAFVLATGSTMNSLFDKEEYTYIRKDYIFSSILSVVLIVFAGLRVTYNDTATYISMYESMDISGGLFSGIGSSLGDNPGFLLVNNFLKILGFSSQSFIMLYSALTIGLYLWFIRKYSVNYWLSIFVFIFGGTYIFAFAAIKQCVAIAISLIAIDGAIDKKWLKFVFWVLLASTFHTYALLFLFVPLLSFKPWTTKTYFLIIIGILVGISFQSALGTILNVASFMGENYNAADFAGEGVNVFRLAVAWAPILLAFFASRPMKHDSDRVFNICFNLTLINAVLMFTARFGTAFYIARLANYFAVFPIITIPWILKYYTDKSGDLLKAVICIGFAGFAYYAYGVNRAFDVMYTSIPFSTYVTSIFH